MPDLTCDERINTEMAQRNAMLRQVMDNPNHDDYFDDPALSIEKFKFTRVCFSYGGPSDYLEIRHLDGEIVAAEYVFHDWYDGARRNVNPGTPLYLYAQSIVEYEENE
jgi:hypothetical protein